MCTFVIFNSFGYLGGVLRVREVLQYLYSICSVELVFFMDEFIIELFYSKCIE